MKRTLQFLSLLAFSATLYAEPVTLTNFEAQKLYIALNGIEAGLTAANTTLVADNLNALLPKVQAYEKGNAAAQKKFKITAATKADDAAAETFSAEVEANAAAQITIDLSRLSLSDDEITAAKIKPGTLAIIRQHLRPALKK
jgi:hypothetical protein